MNPPPLLVCFNDKSVLRRALDGDVESEHWDEIEGLLSANLPPAASAKVLACLFGYSTSFIRALALQPERYYRVFEIRKGKSKRSIQAPKVGLKLIQKWIAEHVGNATEHEEHVFGFIKGRSAPKAAMVHRGARWVYSTDISTFFSSISNVQVVNALVSIGYTEHAATLIASLCCYEGGLAQGSPASPTLSNLVFRPYDMKLRAIAKEHGCRLSRYADDITFSGTETAPKSIGESVRNLLREGGWEMAVGKEILAELPFRLKVHGLLVNGAEVRLTKGYRNRIRAYRHILETRDLDKKEQQRLRGHCAYAVAIENLSKE